VCIPARNEERNIGACVGALLAQDYPNLEVIVLDDRSSDSTPLILAEIASTDSRLQPITGSDLQKGWVGKPHALFQAAAHARGEWLCFVDADTFAARNALSSCYAKAIETEADLFTIMTFQILGSFWEKVVMPLVMTALSVGFSARKVNDPKRKDAIANGQFILVKRSTYDAIGGYESVKNQIVEDKAIAERVKWSGYRLIVADGMRMIRTRMYTSLPEMWEGWTKNIYLGLRDQSSMLMLGIFGGFIALVAAFFLPIWPLLGILWYLQAGGWMAGSVIVKSALLWALLIYERAKVARKLEISPWYAFTTPLGAGIFAAMMLASFWNVLSGRGVTWKGRVYSP
ncbi:MAG TPA: glycosyltransferase, partial [Anaerolineales bacterium]|nr:glycosyltransferase [Anaerolineales bacterium]